MLKSLDANRNATRKVRVAARRATGHSDPAACSRRIFKALVQGFSTNTLTALFAAGHSGTY